MSVVVKAYLARPGQADEIRRFAIDEDVSSNFEYLSGKIADIYPGLGRGGFKLFWLDDEGDKVCFSSDNELMLALGSMRGDVFKVYVTIDLKSSEFSNSGKVHPGVVCDGCEAPVVGNRYKCAVCPDYDLCQTCENHGLHKEHFMMRLAEPCSQGFPFSGPPCFGMPPASGGHPPPPPCGRGSPRGAWGRGGCNRGRSGNRGRFFQHWMRWMHGEHPAQQRARGDDQAEGTSNRQSSPNSSRHSSYNPKEYLKNVGESVAALLDPLGIDVQVDVRHNEQMNSEEKTEDPEKKSAESSRSEELPIEIDDGQPEENSTPPAPMETTQNWTVVDMVESLPEHTSPATAPVAEPAEPLGASAYPPQRAPAPEGVAPPSFSQSLAPNIEAALVKMREMGYSDDGGWLTQLLITKNGDISKVLDVLSPANQVQGGQRV